MPRPCETCSKPVNEQAVVCPHCGARRSAAPTNLGAIAMTPDELRALLVIDSSSRAFDESMRGGAFATLLVPHHRTQGAARIAEVALTVAGLPLIAMAAPMLLVSRSRDRRKAHAPQTEMGAVGTIGLIGGPMAWSVFTYLFGISSLASLVVATGMLVGLFIRASIRTHVSDDKARELLRLERPPR